MSLIVMKRGFRHGGDVAYVRSLMKRRSGWLWSVVDRLQRDLVVLGRLGRVLRRHCGLLGLRFQCRVVRMCRTVSQR